MRHIMMRAALLASTLLLLSCTSAPRSASVSQQPNAALGRIQHLVVIYAENHSFDNLYGLFPGAEGIAQATAEQKTQLDHDGDRKSTRLNSSHT